MFFTRGRPGAVWILNTMPQHFSRSPRAEYTESTSKHCDTAFSMGLGAVGLGRWGLLPSPISQNWYFVYVRPLHPHIYHMNILYPHIIQYIH